jgi:hypothetical protein
VFIPNQDISGNNCECDSRSERRGCWGQSEPGLATGRCAGAVSTVHEQAAQGLKGTVSDIRPSIHNLFSPTQGPSPSMMTMSPKPLAITARSSTACAATPSCSRTTSLRRWKTGRSRARKRCSVRAMLAALDGGGGEHSGCWRSGAAHHTRHAAKQRGSESGSYWGATLLPCSPAASQPNTSADLRTCPQQLLTGCHWHTCS